MRIVATKNSRKEIDKIKKSFENKRAFGDIPKYVIEENNDEITICRNDGVFHKDKKISGQGGYATLIFHGNLIEFYYQYRNELI